MIGLIELSRLIKVERQDIWQIFNFIGLAANQGWGATRYHFLTSDNFIRYLGIGIISTKHFHLAILANLFLT